MSDDLRRLMDLYESIHNAPEPLSEGVRGMDLDAVLWNIFKNGTEYGQTNKSSAYNKASDKINELVEAFGNRVPFARPENPIDEAAATFGEGDRVSYQKNRRERSNATVKTPSSAKKGHVYLDTDTEGTILVPYSELAAPIV